MTLLERARGPFAGRWKRFRKGILRLDILGVKDGRQEVYVSIPADGRSSVVASLDGKNSGTRALFA